MRVYENWASILQLHMQCFLGLIFVFVFARKSYFDTSKTKRSYFSKRLIWITAYANKEDALSQNETLQTKFVPVKNFWAFISTSILFFNLS